MAAMDASLNHGKSRNGTNNSSSAMNSQNPCCEMLVTSTWEVLDPSAADFIKVFLDYSCGSPFQKAQPVHDQRHWRRRRLRSCHIDKESGAVWRDVVEVTVATDGRTIVSSVSRYLTDLYVVEGLK